MLKYVKGLVKNKKGNIGMVYLVLILILMFVDMVYGTMETSLAIATVNEVKDILENIAPGAARQGISAEAHKNEMIEIEYDYEKAEEYFKKEVLDSIEEMNLRGRIKTSRAIMKSKLDDYTSIRSGKGKWVNTWGEGYVEGAVEDNRKEVDYVIVRTVLPVELKVGSGTVNEQKVIDQFNVSDGMGGSSNLTVDLDVGKNSIAVFIKFEMKIVLK